MFRRSSQSFPTRLVLLASFSLGLYRPGVASEPDSVKYWILFADRGPSTASTEHLSAPALSPRALERRRVRGTPDARAADRRVFTEYIDNLNQLDVRDRVTSRWLNGVSAYLTPEKMIGVRQLPFVREIRPVGMMQPVETLSPLDLTDHSALPDVVAGSSDVLYGPSETQLSVVNAIPPLEAGYNGTGVRLGFLDTTFDDFNHPAFDRLRNEGRLVAVRDFTGLFQSNLHGRSVASIAAGYLEGELVGPGYGAEILAATTEYGPTETNQEEDNFVAGLEWLESMGADVVNVSLGYTTFDEGQNSYIPSDLDGDTGITTIAADIAASLGVVMVVSAGNWVSYGCTGYPTCWYYIGTPADGDSVIAVGAVDAAGVRPYFSSFGPTADGRIKPDVAAMGAGVYNASSSTGISAGSGTSYSAPMVAGVVAQMLQANPLLTPARVLDILRQSGNQADNPDNALGWGIIDAEVAVSAAVAVSAESLHAESGFTLSAYPNPFGRHATFSFETTRPGPAAIRIFDVMGREVATPLQADLSPGGHTVIWHASDLTAGVYVYRVTTADGTRSGQIVRI